MGYKKFDKNLHAKFDKAGRGAVKKWLTQQGYEVEDNENRYVVDLIIKRNGDIVGYAEVEVREVWKGEKFPYEDLNIPYRKRKLFQNDLKTLFFSVNCDLTHMLWCDAKTILNCRTQILSNKYARNETFFKVELNKLKYVTL